MSEASVAGLAGTNPLVGFSSSLAEASLLVLSLAFVVFVALGWLWPYGLVRLGLWLTTHSVYRLRVRGRERLPARGGALLVCNHLSTLDCLLLLAAQRRFIRLVLLAGWTRYQGVRHLLSWAGVITVNDPTGARGLVRALRQAREALARRTRVSLRRGAACCRAD